MWRVMSRMAAALREAGLDSDPGLQPTRCAGCNRGNALPGIRNSPNRHASPTGSLDHLYGRLIAVLLRVVTDVLHEFPVSETVLPDRRNIPFGQLVKFF